MMETLLMEASSKYGKYGDRKSLQQSHTCDDEGLDEMDEADERHVEQTEW